MNQHKICLTINKISATKNERGINFGKIPNRFKNENFLNAILKNDTSLNGLRGKIHYHNNIAVLCTYHPSYLLRNPAEKKKSWADLCLALNFVKEKE